MNRDLIIIGAGPGGYELALEAAKKGLSTLLIEANEVGGTCLQCGCIPTKAYYKTAKMLKELKHFSEYGINGSFDFDFMQTFLRKNTIVNNLTQGIKFQLKQAKVDLIYGYARLVSKHEVMVNGEIHNATNIVIATGSSPIKLPLPGFDNERVLSSTELLALEEVPKRLVIVGGGVVGIELATIYTMFGSSVEVIEAQDRILPMFDKEVTKRLLSYLKVLGINFHLASKVTGIEGKKELKVYFEEKETINTIMCDYVLLSIGRRANLDNLGLEEVGITYDKKGINVNRSFQTNIENIYAIGDVTGKMMLAHTATYSGYYVLNHILGKESNIDFNLVPSIVFTIPEVASIGLTEEEVGAIDYKVAKFLFKANGKANTMNEVDGFVKVISSNGKILGIHIIGPHASDLIHEAVALMNMNATVNDVKNMIHAHPTLSEAVSGAFFEID